tara:strand:+ start:233 stop:511 length:279 start_codon:yes stop_codon:yes gene_type:complete
MSEPIKFSNEELEKIKKIQDDYLEIQNLFGQVSLSRLRLQEQIQLLDKKDEENKQKFSDVQKNEKQFLDEITKKYGDGTLNPDTGIFTPNKQ